MVTSHADQHDEDKLSRWCRDLSGDTSDGFPAYAMFLVSPEDRFAHNVFREFRTSFDARRAGYKHLVIYGQHGISTAVRGLLAGLKLKPAALPLLALFAEPSDSAVHVLPLPSGETAQTSPNTPLPWAEALKSIEKAVECGDEDLALDSLPGENSGTVDGGTIGQLAEKVLQQIS